MLPTIDTTELAQWLGYKDGDKFVSASRALINTYSFPRKLPGIKCWSRKAVLQWIERQGGVDPALALSGAPMLEPSDVDLEDLRRDIERTYASGGLQ